MSNPAREVVASYLASFAGGDPDAIAAHVSEDFVNEHTAALGSGCVGRAAYRERLPAFLADMVGLDYAVEDLVVDTDAAAPDDAGRVAAFYRMTARWQGDAPFTVRGVQRLEVADGLITRRTDYWDSAVFLAQVSPDAAAALAPFGVR